MGFFDSKDKTSTTQSQLFPALETGWNRALGSAGKIYQNTKAPKLAPLNDWSTQALNQTVGMAQQGVPNLDQLYQAQSGILGNGGFTGQMTDANNYLRNFADGSYHEDPRLQSVIANERTAATNAALTGLGGGRYGSAAIGQGLGKAQAAATDQLMLQSNENARNRQLQAAGQMGSLATQGANNMATWGAMSPALNELRYDGVARMAGAGDFVQGRRQQRQDLAYNFPKENLNWYTGILGGMGNLGSTTISKTPGPSAAQSILGGALGGATIGSNVPGLGAGWGGILGAGIGAFA